MLDEKGSLQAMIQRMIKRVPPEYQDWSAQRVRQYKAAAVYAQRILQRGNVQQLKEAVHALESAGAVEH